MGVLVGSFVLSALGCSGGDDSDPAGVAGMPATGGAGGGTADCSHLGVARGPSEQCCPSLGLDACGAGLVCAALDGRTVPTCTLEGTQMSLEECTTDSLCISGKCAAGLCASLVTESCREDVGCADPTGAFDHVICTGPATMSGISPDRLTCESVYDEDIGGPCGYCEGPNNCISAGTGYQCFRGRCMGTTGVVVQGDAVYCCANGSTTSGTSRVCL